MKPTCENCKKIQTDIGNSINNLAGSLVIIDIICKCKCGAVHATGKQVNNRLEIKEQTIVIPHPTVIPNKRN